MTITTTGSGVLVLVRHGESTANEAGIFTGVLDVELTSRGVAEAHAAAALLDEAALRPDSVFTSTLKRTIITARLVMDDLGSAVVPHADWRLNERNFGALSGLSKADVRNRYGDEQLHRWRRTVDASPPPMCDAQFHALQLREPFFSLPAQAVTRTENLRAVIRRVSGFIVDEVLPDVNLGRIVLVSSCPWRTSREIQPPDRHRTERAFATVRAC